MPTLSYQEPDGQTHTFESDARVQALIRCPTCRFVTVFVFEPPNPAVSSLVFRMSDTAIGSIADMKDLTDMPVICMRCNTSFLSSEGVREDVPE